MGHYSNCYEADDQQRREDRLKKAAKDYAEVKDALDKVSSFVQNWKDDPLSVGTSLVANFKKLERSITAWRYKEGLLIDNPEILLDKLRK